MTGEVSKPAEALDNARRLLKTAEGASAGHAKILIQCADRWLVIANLEDK